MSSKCREAVCMLWNKTVFLNFSGCIFILACIRSMFTHIFPFCKKIQLMHFFLRNKITLKHMFVWHNKCCSGISPKSCSNPSLHSWERSCSASYLELREGGARVWLLCCTAGSAGGWSVLIDDQSLAWRRVSIAEGPSVYNFSLRSAQLVPQPPLRSMSVCLQAPPYWCEKSEKFSPPCVRNR